MCSACTASLSSLPPPTPPPPSLSTDVQHGDKEVLELWSLLQRKLPRLFEGLEVKPALLHGDLWSGNAAETPGGPGERWNITTTVYWYIHLYMLVVAGNLLVIY